jgi:predicted DsbA family dithiol-disulfide isomerase
VKRGIIKAQQRGISGVPFTILNGTPADPPAKPSLIPLLAGKLAISGAQETETFLDVFKQIASGELKA